MSLRCYRDQVDAEDAAYSEFIASLGPAEKAFHTMTMQDTADALACDQHGAAIGKPCGVTHRAPFVCLSRRMAAARASVVAA